MNPATNPTREGVLLTYFLGLELLGKEQAVFEWTDGIQALSSLKRGLCFLLGSFTNLVLRTPDEKVHTQISKLAEVLENVVHQTLLRMDKPEISSMKYGTLFCHHDLTQKAWPGGMQMFSCNSDNQPNVRGKYRNLQLTDFQSYRQIKWGRFPHIRKELETLIIQSLMLAPDQKAWERDFLGGVPGPNPGLSSLWGETCHSGNEGVLQSRLLEESSPMRDLSLSTFGHLLLCGGPLSMRVIPSP